MSTYAQRGEQVTCENGHPIADIVEDMVRGIPSDNRCNARLSTFDNWRNTVVPQSGEPITGKAVCSACGGSWLKVTGDNLAVLHIGSEWR